MNIPDSLLHKIELVTASARRQFTRIFLPRGVPAGVRRSMPRRLACQRCAWLLVLCAAAAPTVHAAATDVPAQRNPDRAPEAVSAASYGQRPADLIAGEVMGVAYSGFRLGQHPDRGEGAANPSRADINEDLDILLAHGFRLIRMYDAQENSAAVLALIRERELPIKVLLGMWLRAEISNHEGCAWLTEPIPAQELEANRLENEKEVQRGIALARKYPDIVTAVNVGNEALVDWNDHMVSQERVIALVRQVRAAVEQPVTVADNYEWWIRDGAALAAEVDFIGIHTYPVWEDKPIDEALAYTIANVEGVHAALPDRPIAILEAGWATASSEFSALASEQSQRRYYRELKQWAQLSNTTVLFFEAFDEPWKGDAQDLLGAEKHWGLFNVDRTPKAAMLGVPASRW